MTRFPLSVQDLPPPPPGRIGFPWTEGTLALPATLPGGASYPKITVVTPSYQQDQFIEETIRSVLLQGYPNLEYIVIDGGSRDNSPAIIEKYAPFLDYWVSERDKGQANAVNKGFARSSGEIMGWLNSDDVLLPGALYWIARSFINPQTNFVTGFRKVIDENSHVRQNSVQDKPTNYYISHYCCVNQETTYWRRSAWEKLGMLDESLHFALDYDYWLRAIQAGYTFHLIPRYVGGFRNYATNKTNSWIDVYYHDIHILYRRYSMGENEAAIHARLGLFWANRYQLYVRSGEQAWTNSVTLIRLAWNVLEIPILADVIVTAWRLRRAYLDARQSQSRRRAMRSTTALAAGRLIRRKSSAVRWGDVRALPDSGEVGEGGLAFGKNWYATEFYEGNYFRWSGGEGEIIAATDHPAVLKLVVAPGIQSSNHRIDLLDENGKLLFSSVADAASMEINVPVQGGRRSRFQLRWTGATLNRHAHDQRSLAFRVTSIGWRKMPPLEALLDSFQGAVAALVKWQPTGNLPRFISLLVNGVHRWKHAQQVMLEEAALWHQMADDLAAWDAQLTAKTNESKAGDDLVKD